MNIPIIFYHALLDGKSDDGRKYSLGADEFRRQIGYLAENGFTSLSLGDISGQGPAGGRDKKVVISFDDGHASDHSIAYPVLREYGMKGTFFITAGWVGTPGYVSWSGLREMSAAGMEIASHGLTHAFLSDLDAAGLEIELKRSRDMLEGGIGRTVEYISLPGGFCSKAVLDAARRYRYRGVCTSVPGLAIRTIEAGFSVFDRLLITRKTSPDEFRRLVNADRKRISILKAEHHFKGLVRRSLGSKAYYAVWSAFFKKARG